MKIAITVAEACKTVGLARQKLSDAIHSGYLPSLPKTTPGLARVFDRFHMLALWYYREMTDDGYSRASAGKIACQIEQCARANPCDTAVIYIQNHRQGQDFMFPASDPLRMKNLNGEDIRKVTAFFLSKPLIVIDHAIAKAAMAVLTKNRTNERGK